MPWKKRIGAAKTPPRCWASATKRCSTRFASLDWIPGAPLEQTRKLVREEELPARVPRLRISPRRAGIARRSSTCNQLVNEGGEIPRISRCANTSGCRIGTGNLNQTRARAEFFIATDTFELVPGRLDSFASFVGAAVWAHSSRLS